MSETEAPPKISWWKILLPVAIGAGVSIYLVYTNFNPAALKSISLSGKFIGGLLLALLMVVTRDGAFMFKLRLSTGSKMTWRKTFQTVVLWEFAACITPKISEAGLVLYLLKKSGLSYGRSVAALLLNSLLDNAAFVFVFSLLYLILGERMFLFQVACPDLAGHPIMEGLRNIARGALIGYGLLFALVVVLILALFVFPHSAKNLCYRLARVRLLSRFRNGLHHLGDEIEITAHEFKNQTVSFWVQISIAAMVNWVSRYALVCALVFAFGGATQNMLEVFARQYVLWIFFIIPSTPGASGVAEVLFMAMNCEFFPVGLSAAAALLWRIYSYYLYIIVGLALLPKWARQIARR
jgi:uncharacterized protein (TIRG00374 family)